MTKHFVAMSTKKSLCFDTLWRQRDSMRRQKQFSLQQSIVHLFKPLTQSEMREVWLGQRVAAIVTTGPSGRGGVGGYWSYCGHLWHLLGTLSVIGEGKWGQSGVTFVRICDRTSRRQQQDKTGSLRVYPVSPARFVSISPVSVFFFSFSLLAALSHYHPASMLNTEFVYERV